jgi:hypothetical protein
MKDLVLVNDADKYYGKYVATRSFKNKRVISSGTDPLKVYKRAKRLGAKEPVIVYIPKKDEVLIY